jgi:hypothetical protein
VRCGQSRAREGAAKVVLGLGGDGRTDTDQADAMVRAGQRAVTAGDPRVNAHYRRRVSPAEAGEQVTGDLVDAGLQRDQVLGRVTRSHATCWHAGSLESGGAECAAAG